VGGVDWIHLAQDREQVAGSCKCSNEPSGSIKGEGFLTESLLASEEGPCFMDLFRY